MGRMSPTVHAFDWPDRFVVGTLGEPGQRTFFLQVRTGPEILSVSLEKQQAAALADRIDEVLDTLMAEEGNPFSVALQSTRVIRFRKARFSNSAKPSLRVPARPLASLRASVCATNTRPVESTVRP